MKDVLLQAAIKLNKSHKKKKWWQSTVRVLATLVVFCTTYALILPAITMEGEPICEIEAHAHGESCYTEQTVTSFLCGTEEQTNVVHTHDSICYDDANALICLLPEIGEHLHGDECYSQNRTLVCQSPHIHTEVCTATQQVLTCTEAEGEPHAHEESCYEQQEALCELTVDESHVHEDGCYTQEQVLTCEIVQEAHQHTESCIAVETQQVLTCQLPEHTHVAECYPVADQEDQPEELLCGMGIHSHMEGCRNEAGELICSIPEHTHEAACMVADLDLTADVESQYQWEQSVSQLALTGIWSEDVLKIAQSQLGYQESKRNVILVEDRLKGYTRYGQWYGDPYGDWSAMFAAFCVNYAGVENFPVDSDSEAWIQKLTETTAYWTPNAYTPSAGDLVFFDDSLRNGTSASGEHVGLVIGLDSETAKLQVIEGDVHGTVSYVTYDMNDKAIAGYGKLPENPLSPEEWSASNEVAALVAQLPEAQETKTAMQMLNEQGDEAGFEALRQEIVSRIQTILEKYETFNDLQIGRVGSLDNLYALQEVCGGAVWNELPALTGDNATVSQLTNSNTEVISSAEKSEDDTMADLRTNSIHKTDVIRYEFTVDTSSYYTDVSFGYARVKMEFVLPLTPEQAAFDTEAAAWLEDISLTQETRNINGTDTACQVLTGYKVLTSDGNTEVAVPGSFTEAISVAVKDMTHGEKLMVIASAALENSTWEGLCPTHEIEEKLTIVTDSFVLYDPLPAEEQQLVYENYLAQLETEASVEELKQQVHDSYCAGAISDDQYADLHQRLLGLSGVELNSIAEPSVGDGWAWMDFGSTVVTMSDHMVLYSTARTANAPAETAMPMALYSSLELDSNSQIPDNGWGGENSDGDVIWVSKTIEGTEQENVFDITLQIITKDTVNEVYKEPDMAVVVVMDISNTMTSIFSGETTVTRYNAAMDSAEQFLKSFAEETDGVSKVGYVAFNTHGHEVFPMQECSTLTQASTLSNTMRTKTKSIMDAAAKAAGGEYADSHERFTNMEAGLKMAADMLDGVSNRHKYIIFLSDGFPTTYMTASSSDGYKGYDPYTPNGTNGTNGVFYDRVMGVHCDYGTSYSDTAAIKARQMAVSLKNEGINIFSIGVDVAGQTIKYYHDASVNNMQTFSVVERREKESYYNTTGYEIGTLHSEITKANPTAAEKETMAQDFKDWLKGTTSAGIGSGYYYDSTDQDGLEAAYSQIFAKILEMNAESAHLDWVATDPVPDMGVHELDTVEFIGFWDYDGKLNNGPLAGESKDGYLYLNSASFNTETATISWDLKNSGYISTSWGNNKNYMCALKYRVRLQNENEGFVERQIYDTNDTTFLNYRIVEVNNGVTSISDRKCIEFPIPKVFGYLAELSFRKVDPFDRPLEGAEFTLTHDTENCGTCRGDGEGHVSLPVYEAASGADGMVSFTNIPSGHHYTLTETKTPDGYTIVHNHTYQVVVSYDALTVTVTDADGNPLEWTESIENAIYYTLPNTGGTGTSPYTLGGLLIIVTALCGYVIYTGRKRQKGGAKA